MTLKCILKLKVCHSFAYNSLLFYALHTVGEKINILLSDLLKIDFLAQSKHYFWKFCAKKTQKVTKRCLKKNTKKHVKIVKIITFLVLGVLISRFWDNSATFCAVAGPHNCDIEKLWLLYTYAISSYFFAYFCIIYKF